MSQAIHETITLGDIPEAGTSTSPAQASSCPDSSYPLQQAQHQTSQDVSKLDFPDSSGPLFSLYLKLAEEEDNKIAERWRDNAGSILVFSGLFSAAVAAFVVVSIQDLRPNSQDTSAFYLEKMYQFLSSANVSLGGSSVPSTPAKPPPFSPSTTAIWVNSLWFMSFTMSLMCAMLATLQQQWAHRYLKLTQSRCGSLKRARIRAFFADGLQNLRLPWMMDALPTLLHLSLFFFFAGLIVYLFNINLTVYNPVMWWIGQTVPIYVYVTLMPIFRHNSPYSTPLSSVVWFIYTSTLCIFFQTLKWVTASNLATQHRFGTLKDKYKRWLIHGVAKAAEESALDLSPKLDSRTLIWTLETLDDDDKLERFFSTIPGFCRSKIVNDPVGLSIKPNHEKLSADLIGLMCRTLSSNLVSDSVRIRRMKVCAEAMKAATLPITLEIFNALCKLDEREGLLRSAEFGLFLRMANHDDRLTGHYSQLIISTIIANAREHDARWFELTTGHLGIPESVLRRYLSQGDSALLANCTRIIRCIFQDFSLLDSSIGIDSLVTTVKSVSKFAIRDTLPELQHDFCALWNEIVLGMWSNEDPLIRHASVTVLSHVRHLYLTLHQGTDAAPSAFSVSTADHAGILHQRSSYPLCDIPGHDSHSDSASQVPKVVLGGTASTSSASSLIFQYDDAALTMVTPASPDAHAPSFSSPNLNCTNIYPAGLPPGDLPHFPPVAVLPHSRPLGNYPTTAPLRAATPGASHGTVDPSVISSMPDPVLYTHSSCGAPPQNRKKYTPPPTPVPDALSFPTLIPSPSRAPPEGLRSSSDSAVSRFWHIPQGAATLSSPSLSPSPATPQVASDLGRDVIASSKSLRAYNKSQNTDIPIRMETSRHPFQSESPTPRAVSQIWRPESRDSLRGSAQDDLER